MNAAKIGWLVSYPKSGNTWLRMMLSCLCSGRSAVDINGPDLKIGIITHARMDELLGIESSELSPEEIAAAYPALHAAIVANADEALILYKLHDRFWRIPTGQAAFSPSLTKGAIYLVRDPRDVAVSYAHHRGVAIDRVIALMADPAATLAESQERMKEQLPQPLGRWSDHVASWLDQSEIPVLAVRYEDLLSEPQFHLAAIAAHLGIAADQQAIRSAVTATRFDVLQAQERAHGFRERRQGSSAPFFREGRTGRWSDVLSSVQEARIVECHHAAMARFGYL
jgi:aryl sulfotransferase